MFKVIDWVTGVHRPGHAAFTAIGVAAWVLAAWVALPGSAVAHDDNGPLQPHTWSEPEATDSHVPDASPAPTGHLARLQVGLPLWHAYRSHKSSRTLASTASEKDATASLSKNPAAAVSIYEDKTLRRGDAVMTSAGLRIFEGSLTFPYRPADFSTLEASKGVRRSLRKDLALYDHQIPDRPEVAFEAPDMVIHVSGLAQR